MASAGAAEASPCQPPDADDAAGGGGTAATTAAPHAAAPPTSWAARLQASTGARSAGAAQPASHEPPQKEAAAPCRPAAALVSQAAHHASVPVVVQRGCVNPGNVCFVNSTVQALLGCTPFVELLQHVAETSKAPTGSCATPTLRSLAALAAEFLAADSGAAPRARPAASPVAGVDDIFAPLLDSLEKSVGAGALTAREARRATRHVRLQQDAQEFLSLLLATAHAELLQLKQKDGGSAATMSTPPGDRATSAAEADDEAWECVGRRRNTSFVSRSHQELVTPHAASLVSDIFGGVQASRVKRTGAKTSVTQEPFMILSLDVCKDHVNTLEDALAEYCSPEPLYGFTDEKGDSTAASRSLAISRAPRVLLIHLKLFTYTAHGEEKLRKRVAFGEHLTLGRGVCEGRESARYRLAALVEHIGPFSKSGHYVAFARDASSSAWLRFDDAVVQTASLQAVLGRQAYILCFVQS